METVIDWSKWPHDAELHLPNQQGTAECAVKFSESGSVFFAYSKNVGWTQWAGENKESLLSRFKYTSRTWTGEGLPPVGTVCERCTHSDVYDGRHEEVKILAHTSKGFPVWENTDGTFAGIAKEEFFAPGMPAFRPISTPEQIAAVERQRAIYDAMSETKVNWEEIEKGPIGLVLEVIVSQLYDAGYRLQVQP